MAIYTQRTCDFSVDPAIRQENNAGTGPIVQSYVDAGYCPQYPVWTPALPGGTYPPSSGTYIARKEWTDLTQAQNCVAAVNAWLAAHPECLAFGPGPQVIQE
jgi:hypothetical protein